MAVNGRAATYCHDLLVEVEDLFKRGMVMIPEDYKDFVHTGPGTLAGRYLRTFWQPVYVSEKLEPGWAKPISVMGQDFTLYRGESGRAHLVGGIAARIAGRSSRWAGWKGTAYGVCTMVGSTTDRGNAWSSPGRVKRALRGRSR